MREPERQESDDAILSDLGIVEWLEAYQHISASAIGKRGPIRPGPGKVYDVVPGPYPDWHYVALALKKLLQTVVDQKSEIERLNSRIEALEQERGSQ
ncbi:MAG: hypothetical protein F4Y20_05060 [Acidobacteria bacterium]|nr:hypothetical protein [Acidobacteriota bacterium]MYK79997.1 hypothetical protein [Acidobacteriota bacterium]